MNNFKFNNPWLLFLIIPLVVLIVVGFFMMKKEKRYTKKNIISFSLHLVIAVLISVAFADPSYLTVDKETDVFILVDASASEKTSTDRIDKAIKEVRAAALETPNTKVGVIPFAKEAKTLVELGGSFNSINAFMLSQSGVFVSAKEFIDDLAPRQIYALAICGVSTISSTIIGAYLQMVEPKYVVTATVMNMLMGLLVINIVFPRDVESEGEIDMSFIENRPAGNILQVIGDYATTGFNTVVAIGISLMAFLALIQLLNMICSGLFHIDFQHILGYVFYPVAWIMGAGKDSLEVGNLIATKLVSNEFVAISGMAKMHLSEHAKAITSVALLSFANLSSIGIVGGAISGVSTKQSDVFYKKGFKVLFAAFISSLLIGSIVGLFVA